MAGEDAKWESTALLPYGFLPPTDASLSASSATSYPVPLSSNQTQQLQQSQYENVTYMEATPIDMKKKSTS